MPLPDYIEPYWPMIVVVARRYGFDPYIIAAIGDRETMWGTSSYCRPKGAACLGDHGHGHGLFQIDDRWHPEFCAGEDWKDPEKNADYAIGKVLKPAVEELGYVTQGISAFNCGVGNVKKALKLQKKIDFYTTGKDYSEDVLHRAEEFKA